MSAEEIWDSTIVGKDGITPAWGYDEDGYCVACGNGMWKYHFPECPLADLLYATARVTEAERE